MKQFFVVLLMVPAICFSALPPLAQDIREIKAILSDSRFTNAIGMGESIEKIQKKDHSFVIVTNRKTLQVDVVYLHQRRIGPAKFSLQFGNPVERE